MSRRTAASESTSTGPLAGVKVLDLSIALTGPYAVALLADQGAEVVKVERPGIGDIARWIGVSVNGMSAFYLACNRGKRCIAVDLATDAGRQIVLALAATSDVIVQNFRPGVIDRLGLGYEAVRALNPEVIYCSVSGYGPEGPYSHRSAYDTSIQAYGGFAANQADPNGGPPTFLRQNARRQGQRPLRLPGHHRGSVRPGQRPRWTAPRAGHGRRLRVVPVGRIRRQRGAARLRRIAGTRASTPASQPMRFLDGWGIAVPTTDADFAGICRPSAFAGFDDPRIATVGRAASSTATCSSRSWTCATPWLPTSPRPRRPSASNANASPSRWCSPPPRSSTIPTPEPSACLPSSITPSTGRTRLPRHPTRFHGTPAALGGAAPALGEHTDEVLVQLGLGDRIEELRAAGVLA